MRMRGIESFIDLSIDYALLRDTTTNSRAFPGLSCLVARFLTGASAIVLSGLSFEASPISRKLIRSEARPSDRLSWRDALECSTPKWPLQLTRARRPRV